jgi:hypothetical protein
VAPADEGAAFVADEGCGHCWMLYDPARGARVLDEFWATLS